MVIVDILLLREQFLDHLSAKLTELFMPAGVKESQLIIIEPEQMQQGHVQIADGMHALDGLGSEFVGRADGVAGLDDIKSGERERPMIPPNQKEKVVDRTC
jgi:hypothetical protein